MVLYSADETNTQEQGDEVKNLKSNRARFYRLLLTDVLLHNKLYYVLLRNKKAIGQKGTFNGNKMKVHYPCVFLSIST